MAGGQYVRTFALYQRPVASRVCLFASFAAIFFLFHAVLLFSSSPALRRHERHEDLWRNNAPVGNSAWSETPQNKNNCLGLFEFDVMTGARGTTGTNDNQYKGAGACTETTYIATRIAPCSRYEVSVHGSAAATGRVVLLLPPWSSCIVAFTFRFLRITALRQPVVYHRGVKLRQQWPHASHVRNAHIQKSRCV